MSDGSAAITVVPAGVAPIVPGLVSLGPTVPQLFTGMREIFGIHYAPEAPRDGESGSVNSLLKAVVKGKGQVWLTDLTIQISVFNAGGEYCIVAHGEGEEPSDMKEAVARPNHVWHKFNDATVGSSITTTMSFPPTVSLQLQPPPSTLPSVYLTIMTEKSKYQFMKEGSTVSEMRYPDIHVNYVFTWSCSAWVSIRSDFRK